MKVYVVIACLDRNYDPDKCVNKVFMEKQKAIDYAVDIGVEAMNNNKVPVENRVCVYPEDNVYTPENMVFGIIDNDDWEVEVYVIEKDIEDVEDSLKQFLIDEAKFRMKSFFKLDDNVVSTDLVNDVVGVLHKNFDVILNFDSIDSFIDSVLKERCIDY